MDAKAAYHRDIAADISAHVFSPRWALEGLAYLDLALDGPTSRLTSHGLLTLEQNKAFSRDRASRQSIAGDSLRSPPRLAKEGHEWVWLPHGYWVERRLHGKGGSSISPEEMQAEIMIREWRSSSSKSMETGIAGPQSPHDSPTMAIKESLQQLFDAGHFPALPTPLRESLQTPNFSEMFHTHTLQHPGHPVLDYMDIRDCNWIRAEGLSSPPWAKTSVPSGVDSAVDEPVEAPVKTADSDMAAPRFSPPRWRNLSNVFRRSLDKGKQPFIEMSLLSPGDTSAEATSAGGKGFAKVRWNQHGLELPPGSLAAFTSDSASATPSPRSGPPLDASPNSYLSSSHGPSPLSSSEVYVLSASGKHRESSYPGGEATRLDTPPSDEETADVTDAIDATDATDTVDAADAADTTSEEHRTTVVDMSSPTDVKSKSGSPAHRTTILVADSLVTKEWIEVTRGKKQKWITGRNGLPFEFKIQDHLSDSPMCPINRQSGQARRICVLHGTRKRVINAQDGSKNAHVMGIFTAETISITPAQDA